MKFRTVIAISFATASVWAGDSGWSGKAPITEKAPIEECYDLGGEISAVSDLQDQWSEKRQFDNIRICMQTTNFAIQNLALLLNGGLTTERWPYY